MTAIDVFGDEKLSSGRAAWWSASPGQPSVEIGWPVRGGFVPWVGRCASSRGDTLLLSDGDLALKVIGTTEEDVHCRVITGGTLASRKGVNLPARSITAPTFTDKDRDDLAFGLRYGVDYVALSFVRTAADVLQVQAMIQDHGSPVPLIAKIETHDALTNIDGTDAVMLSEETAIGRFPVGDTVVITAGVPVGRPGMTNLIKVETV